MTILVATLLAFVISGTIVWLLIHGNLPIQIPFDIPNERSLHVIPLPRCGGIAVVAAVLIIAVLFLDQLGWLIGSSLALSIVSLIDDKKGLSIPPRLLAHLGASGLVVFHLPLESPHIFLAAIAIVASTNFYNFMDGANGLAGGVSVIGFAVMAIAAGIQGDVEISLLSSVIAAASAGFLLFNFGNARIFLGDTGSIPLGFLAGGIGIAGWAREAWPLIFPGLVFFPFILDPVVTLIKRVYGQHIFWKPHREHYYQRIILLGWPHRRIALIYYGLTGASSSLGLFILNKEANTQLLCSVALLIIVLFLMRETDKLWDKRA